MTPTWQILVCSVQARTSLLVRLLDSLAPQLAAYDGHVQVLVDRDNGAKGIGPKRTGLVEQATADYVCFVDDDDRVSPDYVTRVMLALAGRPDYVGFVLSYSVDGRQMKPAYHSLGHGNWYEDGRAYYRGISHLNPIRRDAALAGLPFRDGFGEDADWGERVQATGLVQTECFLADPPVYFYDYSSTESLFRGGQRTLGTTSAHPEYEHVIYVGDT